MRFLEHLLTTSAPPREEPEPEPGPGPGDGGSEELSDAELEEVLGGLQRIHVPQAAELRELPV